MTVTPTTLSAGVTRTITDQSSKLSAALNNRETPIVAPTKSVDASAPVRVDTTTQSKLSDSLNLRVQSVGVAFTASNLDVIDSGAAQVLRILGQLQSLASRASLPGLSDSERSVLDGQFQALRLSINNVPPAPPGSEFTGAALVAGTGIDLSKEDAKAVVGGFKDTNFLGEGTSTNLLTEKSAQKAVETIAVSATGVASQRDTLVRLQQTVNFAAASVDAALQNQEALKASFDDVDVAAPALAAQLQDQAVKVAAAQTNRLPNNILQLLAQ